MRVLAWVSLALVGACYTPDIADCQFTCADGVTCPDGLSCVAKVCRVANAPALCPGEPAPSCDSPPNNCTSAGSASGSGAACAAICNSDANWADAEAACAAKPGWQLAVFDGALPTNTFGGAVAWIGLTRSPGAPVSTLWHWIDNSGSVAPTDTRWDAIPHAGVNANTCAGLKSGALFSDDCTVSHKYVCTLNGSGA